MLVPTYAQYIQLLLQDHLRVYSQVTQEGYTIFFFLLEFKHGSSTVLSHTHMHV